MCRRHSDGAWTLDGYEATAAAQKPVNRYGTLVTMLHALVNESTTHVFVPENALAGPIPSQIGQMVQLARLYLNGNQLTGECRETHLIAIGKRVYH